METSNIIYIRDIDDIKTECDKLNNYIVYFCSSTCDPCQKLMPIIEKTLNIKTVLNNVTIVKVDINLENISKKKEALKLIYNFKNIPHFKFYVKNIETDVLTKKIELLSPTSDEYECIYKMVFNKLI
jgi:thiol-disulfide isomerase/thioredoxin